MINFFVIKELIKRQLTFGNTLIEKQLNALYV